MSKVNSLPRYITLVKALNELRKWVDGCVLNSCSPKEIRDTYAELARASTNAQRLVRRAERAIVNRAWKKHKKELGL